MAVKAVTDAAKLELQDPDPIFQIKPSNPNKSTTQRRRKSATSQSPVRLRNTRRRSSTQLDDDTEPEEQFLRNMGLSLPAEANSESSRVEALEQVLTDRMSKLEGHVASLQSTTESSISSHVLDAHTTLQLIEDSLFADSNYHKLQLLDVDLDSSVTMSERDVQNVQKSLEAVDLGKLQARNLNRDDLVERWSRQ